MTVARIGPCPDPTSQARHPPRCRKRGASCIRQQQDSAPNMPPPKASDSSRQAASPDISLRQSRRLALRADLQAIVQQSRAWRLKRDNQARPGEASPGVRPPFTHSTWTRPRGVSRIRGFPYPVDKGTTSSLESLIQIAADVCDQCHADPVPRRLPCDRRANASGDSSSIWPRNNLMQPMCSNSLSRRLMTSRVVPSSPASS